MKYRKKPVVVDAVQVKYDIDWPEWFRDAVNEGFITTHNFWDVGRNPSCTIKTLEGEVIAREGDYIVMGSFQDEYWPVRKDIFEATYELVEE